MSNLIITRFLNNPLQFIPGKHKESDTNNDKFDNFIVLSKNQPEKLDPVVPNSSHVDTTLPMKKPKSMAEAVAAYTGKKFLSKREKRKLQIIESPSLKLLDDEDLGEDLGEDFSNSDDSSYESAEEFLNQDNSASVSENDSSSSHIASGDSHSKNLLATSSSDEIASTSPSSNSTPAPGTVSPDDEESSPDEDFNSNQESTQSSSEDDLETNDGEADESSGSDDFEQLKHDLKQDKVDNDQKADVEAEEDEDVPGSTPPTSPEEEEDTKQIVNLSEFYNINEFYQDKGSNPKSKIYKNWRELMNSSQPIGLLNHGVTCYMNSAIQSIIHIPAMQHYLNDINKGKYDSILKPRSVSQTLAELSKRMWDSNNGKNGNKKVKYINPKKIIQRLDDINCMMSEWQQEDSHEYFMSLMSRLQEDSTPKGTKLNQSIVYDIFGGLLLQKITCMNCKNISETNQEFYDLSLGFNKKRHNQIEAVVDSSNNTPPPTPGKYTIEKSIKDYFSNELIKLDKNDSQSGYTCENCHQKTIANKISYINQSPETLTIHLKRFKFNGNSSSKVKQSISYSNYLDLTKYTVDGTPTKYRLISVIVHEGRSLSSGHYISHCLQPDGSWCTYDDEYINKIPEQQALSDPAAYVLIYTKLTPKASVVGNKRTHEDGSQDKKKKRKVN